MVCIRSSRRNSNATFVSVICSCFSIVDSTTYAPERDRLLALKAWLFVCSVEERRDKADRKDRD